MEDVEHRSCALRTSRVLRAAERRAVRIRKLLKRIRQRIGPKGAGVMGDAVALAENIELLARFGQHATAVEAVEIESRVETLSAMLRNEIDAFFTS